MITQSQISTHAISYLKTGHLIQYSDENFVQFRFFFFSFWAFRLSLRSLWRRRWLWLWTSGRQCQAQSLRRRSGILHTKFNPPASEASEGVSKFNWKKKSTYPRIRYQRICLSVRLWQTLTPIRLDYIFVSQYLTSRISNVDLRFVGMIPAERETGENHLKCEDSLKQQLVKCYDIKMDKLPGDLFIETTTCS